MSPGKKWRKGVQVSTAILGLVVIVAWLSGFFKDKIEPGTLTGKPAIAAVGAATATVQEVQTPIVEEVAGTIRPARKTIVSSRILSPIRSIRVSAGDTVQAGQLLIVLDDRDLVARVEEARKAVEAAEATKAKTERDFRRASELVAKQVVSQSEFDQVSSAYKVAQARLAAAKQALQAAEVALSYTVIKAPISGRVVDRLAEPGDTASPGQPLLRLYDPDALRVEAPVRESVATRLKVGDKVSVKIQAVPYVIDGTVDEIVPQAEAGSRTFLVKVGIPKRQGIYTGMFGRLLIPAGERKRLIVPSAAVKRVGQLAFASLVDTQGRTVRRLITLGAEVADGQVEVLSGLRPGDKVLIPAD